MLHVDSSLSLVLGTKDNEEISDIFFLNKWDNWK